MTDALAERRVVTVLHELAHMWFGDYVTMKWWNDLWLNESFAEFTSTLATAEATDWKDAWATFCSGEKSWALAQDQLSTTHPIVAPINDLNDTYVNFDGITYAKGASVLKQLVAYVGRERFFEGISHYLNRHAYSNATLNDLLDELEATSGRDLKTWSAKWLEQAGINTISTAVQADADGKITSLTLTQAAPTEFPVLRPHRLAVGFYDEDPQTARSCAPTASNSMWTANTPRWHRRPERQSRHCCSPTTTTSPTQSFVSTTTASPSPWRTCTASTMRSPVP